MGRPRRARSGLPERADPACDRLRSPCDRAAIALQSPYLPACDRPAIGCDRPVFNPPIPPSGSQPRLRPSKGLAVMHPEAREERPKIFDLPKNQGQGVFSDQARGRDTSGTTELGFLAPARPGETFRKARPPPLPFRGPALAGRNLSPPNDIDIAWICGLSASLPLTSPRALALARPRGSFSLTV
jgi:hypothetical protein